MDKEKSKKVLEEEIKAEKAAEAAEPKQAEAGLPETESAEELPESVTLTREEFAEVKAHIDKLQKERDDTVQLAQRLQADFDNFRRRNASVHLDGLDEGARGVIKELLPVLDNFDRALQNGADEASGWADGVKLVYKQFYEALEKSGLSEIPADGMFDPNLHEAVMQEEAEGKESGSILAVLQKGYKVKERIIRHSMVKVAK